MGILEFLLTILPAETQAAVGQAAKPTMGVEDLVEEATASPTPMPGPLLPSPGPVLSPLCLPPCQQALLSANAARVPSVHTIHAGAQHQLTWPQQG